MKNSEKICIITDLDGTLLPKNKKPLAQDLLAIREFEQAGGVFTIATGRTVQASEYYMHLLNLKSPVIVFNGACIYDYAKKTMLFMQALPDSVKIMTEEIFKEKSHVGIEVLCAENTWVVNNTHYEQEHIKICGVTPKYATVPEIQGNWIKVLFSMSPDDMPDFIDYIANKNFQNVSFIRSELKFYEMLPSGVSKGSALMAYKNLPNMQDFKFIAVGDFDNDIAMLKSADLAVCPANATDSVKAVSDIILTRTCEQGAMEELITRILSREDFI
ncbi:MAG: HAD-IIB family hydrolase [Oscillospiraceae bacterium]|nr:HAD-IIB family hydrolase [Oscillospiraceae bacterium]